MTLALRIILIVVSLLTLVFITRSVRNSKVKLEDAVLWFCFAGLLLVVSVFPGVFYWLASVTGVQTTSNFCFSFLYFCLKIRCNKDFVLYSSIDKI